MAFRHQVLESLLFLGWPQQMENSFFSRPWRREKEGLLMWGALVSKTAYEEGSVKDGELYRL